MIAFLLQQAIGDPLYWTIVAIGCATALGSLVAFINIFG